MSEVGAGTRAAWNAARPVPDPEQKEKRTSQAAGPFALERPAEPAQLFFLESFLASAGAALRAAARASSSSMISVN